MERSRAGHWQRKPLRGVRHGWGLLAAMVMAGCGAAPSGVDGPALTRRVDTLLGHQPSVQVPAARLAPFAWQQLCFQRGASLDLVFKQAGGRSHTLSLPYEAFFVDEAYVPGSLDGQCLAPEDAVLIRRKYPGHPAPVAFARPPG